MTDQDLDWFNGKQQKYVGKRSSGWKMWIPNHGWHYGFLSRGQAEWAMEHRSTPEESSYVKDDGSYSPSTHQVEEARIHY